MLRKEIELGRLVYGVYNFSQAQPNNTSTVSLTLLHQCLGHPSNSTMKQLVGFSNDSNSSLHDYFICFQVKQY